MKNKREIKEERNECCGTCKYHEHESVDDGWVCLNAESRYCEDDLTEYDDICEDWETRE